MKVKECKMLDPLGADENATVLSIAKKIKQKKVRQFTIVKDNQPVGILSAVDIVNNVVAEGKDPSKLKAKDIMTSPIISCNADDPAFKTYLSLTQQNIMSCPVVEKGKFIGTVTVQSIMTSLNKKAKKLQENAGN